MRCCETGPSGCCASHCRRLATAQVPANPDPDPARFSSDGAGDLRPRDPGGVQPPGSGLRRLTQPPRGWIAATRRDDQRRRHRDDSSTGSQSGFVTRAASRRGQLFAPAMEGQVKRMLSVQADAGDGRGHHGRRSWRVRRRCERYVLEEVRPRNDAAEASAASPGPRARPAVPIRRTPSDCL